MGGACRFHAYSQGALLKLSSSRHQYPSSLLPSFPGLEAWKQALEYGVKYTGCTVHLVDRGIDTGPILWQETVPVLNEDTPDSLHARIQEAEHRIYPQAVQCAIDGRLTVREDYV